MFLSVFSCAASGEADHGLCGEQEELVIGQSSLDASTRGVLMAGGRRLVAEQMLRHLSDPGQVSRDLPRQHSDSGLTLARCAPCRDHSCMPPLDMEARGL